jgi:hypothetical protein
MLDSTITTIQHTMPPSPSLLALHALQTLTRFSPRFTHCLPKRNVLFLKTSPSLSSYTTHLTQSSLKSQVSPFSTTATYRTTLNQVRRSPRKPQPARRPISPAMTEHSRPSMKGVCLKVGITKPKKPNSGQRKVGLRHPYIFASLCPCNPTSLHHYYTGDLVQCGFEMSANGYRQRRLDSARAK